MFLPTDRKIAYKDIQDFCDQNIRENVNLDYKMDFSSKNFNLEKTIAAFANTYGGLIIIGVGDEDGYPKLPALGVDYRKGLSEQVTKIVIDNVYPIVFVNTQVCINDDKTKAFVVIRIPQSNNTPHAIKGKTEAYVRINDIRNPEPLATIDQIEWLRNKREKSVELRKSLVDEAKFRHNRRIYENHGKENAFYLETLSTTFRRRTPAGHGYIAIIPIYPTESLSNPDEIIGFFNDLCIDNYYGSFRKFPRLSEGKQVTSNAIIIKEDNKSYTEFNEFGLFYYGENFVKDLSREDKKQKEIIENPKRKNEHIFGYFIFYHLLARLDESLEVAYRFQNKIGYCGYVEISFFLDDLDSNYLCFNEEELRDFYESLDGDFYWKRVVPVQDLHDKRLELMNDFCKNMGWHYSLQLEKKLNGGLVENYLKRHNRLGSST